MSAYEIVVPYRQNVLCYVVDGDGEHCRLARKIRIVCIGVREGDVDVEGLAREVSHQLRQESVYVIGNAYGDRGALAVGASSVKGDAVHLADVVDVDLITVVYSTVRYLLGVRILAQERCLSKLYVALLYFELAELGDGDVIRDLYVLEKSVVIVDAAVAEDLFFFAAGAKSNGQHQKY